MSPDDPAIMTVIDLLTISRSVAPLVSLFFKKSPFLIYFGVFFSLKILPNTVFATGSSKNGTLSPQNYIPLLIIARPVAPPMSLPADMG